MTNVSRNARHDAWSLTPFISGTSDKGSVAIDASSRKTIGKSICFRTNMDAADKHVVQTCHQTRSRLPAHAATHHIGVEQDISVHRRPLDRQSVLDVPTHVFALLRRH